MSSMGAREPTHMRETSDVAAIGGEPASVLSIAIRHCLSHSYKYAINNIASPKC